jgi:hypothetical protein
MGCLDLGVNDIAFPAIPQNLRVLTITRHFRKSALAVKEDEDVVVKDG